MAFLTRTDPTRNINRFYVVDITPTLFGEWAVLREWGRRRLTRYHTPRNLASTPRCANRRGSARSSAVAQVDFSTKRTDDAPDQALERTMGLASKTCNLGGLL
jgi:hypothetical protein